MFLNSQFYICVCVCVVVCREKVRDIEELRRAVKQEAGKLEKQLNELAHHYDDSLKMVTLYVLPFLPIKRVFEEFFSNQI